MKVAPKWTSKASIPSTKSASWRSFAWVCRLTSALKLTCPRETSTWAAQRSACCSTLSRRSTSKQIMVVLVHDVFIFIHFFAFCLCCVGRRLKTVFFRWNPNRATFMKQLLYCLKMDGFDFPLLLINSEKWIDRQGNARQSQKMVFQFASMLKTEYRWHKKIFLETVRVGDGKKMKQWIR